MSAITPPPLVKLRSRARAPRRLLLVALDWTRDKDPRVPLGHASLLANLRKYRVEVMDYAFSLNAPTFDPQQVCTAVVENARTRGAPCDLAIGVYIWNERVVQSLLPRIRELGFRGRIILGGPQISYAQGSLEQLYPHADGFVRGPGEAAIVEAVTQPDGAPIGGVHWAGTADVSGRAEVDLAMLPSPFLTGVVPLGEQRYLRWETQRGCRFHCTFCQHREHGARLRSTEIPLDRLREEIALFKHVAVSAIDVLDPIFNSGSTHLAVLEEIARQQLSAHLSLQCRFELAKPEFLDLCVRVGAFPEFGLQSIHEAEWRAVKRGNTMQLVESVIGQLARRRLSYMVTLIYGLPEQTLASFRATVDYCLQRRVPVIRAFPLNLLRGTALEMDRSRWDLVESDDPIPVVVSSSTYDRADWNRMQRLAEALRRTEGQHPRSIDELDTDAERPAGRA
jgi:radical SAM superfamily enzyme YgiQ (UPF0313 family)